MPMCVGFMWHCFALGIFVSTHFFHYPCFQWNFAMKKKRRENHVNPCVWICVLREWSHSFRWWSANLLADVWHKFFHCCCCECAQNPENKFDLKSNFSFFSRSCRIVATLLRMVMDAQSDLWILFHRTLLLSVGIHMRDALVWKIYFSSNMRHQLINFRSTPLNVLCR